MRKPSPHTRPISLVFLVTVFLFSMSACTHHTGSGQQSTQFSPAPNLTGTAWQLRSIQSMADEQPTLTVDIPEHYTLHFQENGRVSLRLDCNRGMGQWQATEAPSRTSGQLTFGPIAMTRMFCPQPSLDTRIARDLGLVRSYLLDKGRLYLSLMADGGIYEWQPIPKQP